MKNPTDADLMEALPVVIEVMDKLHKLIELPVMVRDLCGQSMNVHKHALDRLTVLLKDEAMRRWGEESNFS